MELETTRLVIRRFVMADAHRLREIGMAYEASDMANYDHGPWPADLESYLDIIENWSKSDDCLAVVSKENEKLVGFISRSINEDGEYELGYNFHPDARGVGYATEACTEVLRSLFEDLGAERVNAGTAKVNVRSKRLLEKLGFRFVKETVVSFRKDEKGAPIEFPGLDFVLTADDWRSCTNR